MLSRLSCHFTTTLTILTPASLRDVEKEEGPVGARINACRKMSKRVLVLPDLKIKHLKKFLKQAMNTTDIYIYIYIFFPDFPNILGTR